MQMMFIPSKTPLDMFNREKAADSLEWAKYLQGVSAVGYQHGLLSGLHIFVRHQQFNLLVLDFRRSAKSVVKVRRQTTTA